MLHIARDHDRRNPSWSTSLLSLSLLALTVVSEAASTAKTAADYFVKSLPGQPDGPLLRMHAGHIEITPEHNGNIFFWHYANRHIADRRRTVIWLNGGPGCSSEDGGLMEIGPYRVGKGGNLTYNDGSWDEFANLLFVDNPVGTGFSYVDGNAYLHELQEMADNFIIFLEKFFILFPHYTTDDIYLAGESYAGQHIPYVAQAMLDRNKKVSPLTTKWNLGGLLIGNGWISAAEQYRSYASFAYSAGLVQGGTPESEQVDKALADCLKELNEPGAPERVNVPICEDVLTTVLEVTRKDNQCLNMYDVRLRDSYPSCGMNWPPDLENVTPYLRRNDVVNALHVNRDKREGWQECSGAVSQAFRAINSKSAITLLPGILEAGVPILLFSGDQDMICNHIGTEDLISNMKWSDGTGFELSGDTYAPKRDWEFEGEPAGIYQEARNLTYVKFYNASHMVPFDWPRRSRDMLDRFMGVDIAGIGGKPANSEIDGEAAHSETSVGGHSNTTSSEHEKGEVHKAKIEAYYHSGEAALVVVIIIAIICGFLFWRNRRRSQMGIGGKNDTGERGKYMSLNNSTGGANGSASASSRKGKARDLEAGDFDENELDDLTSKVFHHKHNRSLEEEPYDLASDTSLDESDVEDQKRQQQRRKSRSEKKAATDGKASDKAGKDKKLNEKA